MTSELIPICVYLSTRSMPLAISPLAIILRAVLIVPGALTMLNIDLLFVFDFCFYLAIVGASIWHRTIH